jgi:hypothetical protein
MGKKANPVVRILFANRTLELIEISNNTKHPNKNGNYNKIFEMPFVFNLQTVSMARCCYRFSLSRPEIDGCLIV